MDSKAKNKSKISVVKKISKTKSKRAFTASRDPDGGKIFKCREANCDGRFKTKNRLSDHVRNVHCEPIPCSYSNCDAVLKPHSLKQHITLVHERIKVECSHCHKKVSKIHLTRHFDICTSDGSRPYVCKAEGCTKAFRTSYEQSNHFSKVHSKPVECPFKNCDVVCQKVYLPTHVRLVHHKVKETCDNCGKKVSYGSLKQHQKGCLSDGSLIFKCTLKGCDKSYKTEMLRYAHVRAVHTERIECPFPDCDSTFKPNHLPAHVRQVHDKMKHKCENCGKKVSHDYMTKHLKRCTSDGSRPYKCSKADCGKTFRTTEERSKHLSQVHRQSIECPFSDCKAVIKRCYLSQHVRLVHDKMKEKCSNCGKELSYGSLNQHLKICTSDGSRPFECEEDECEATFKTSADRWSHVRNVHSDLVECTFSGCDAKVRKTSLARHVKLVHEKLKKKCSKCGEKYAYAYLPKHIKSCLKE